MNEVRCFMATRSYNRIPSVLASIGLATSSLFLSSCNNKESLATSSLFSSSYDNEEKIEFPKTAKVLRNFERVHSGKLYHYISDYVPVDLILAFVEKKANIKPEEIAEIYGLGKIAYDPMSDARKPIIAYVSDDRQVTYSDYFDALKYVSNGLLSEGSPAIKRLDEELDLRATKSSDWYFMDLSVENRRVYIPIEVIKLLKDSSLQNVMEQTKKLSESYPGSGVLPNSKGVVFVVMEDTKTRELELKKVNIDNLVDMRIGEENLFQGFEKLTQKSR